MVWCVWWILLSNLFIFTLCFGLFTAFLESFKNLFWNQVWLSSFNERTSSTQSFEESIERSSACVTLVSGSVEDVEKNYCRVVCRVSREWACVLHLAEPARHCAVYSLLAPLQISGMFNFAKEAMKKRCELYTSQCCVQNERSRDHGPKVGLTIGGELGY